MRRSTLIVGAGGLIVLVGAAFILQPWLEAYRWQNSPAAVQVERNAAAPLVIPVRPTATVASPAAPVTRASDGPRPTPIAPAAQATSPGAAAPPGDPPPTPVTSPLEPQPAPELATPPPPPAPTATLTPAELQLGDVAFQFLDPPQPGATARLSVAIHNPTDAPGGPVSLDLPLTWLHGYEIEGVVPLPVDGRLTGQRTANNLRLTLDGPAAGDDLQIDVYLITTAEVIDAPDLRVVDAQGRQIGRAHPPTEAPRAEPGPVYAIDIPRLRLHAGVVPVEWEPPLFAVGQLRSSAYVTQGNSVLVGHVRGAPGYNVFDHLDQLHTGDQVIASSRGVTYGFVVTERQVLSKDDPSPTLPTDTPRLTLMTCAGDWNPLTGDYPERLWVIAEPVDVVAARAVREAQAPSAPPAQVADRGGLGNTDVDLAGAFGATVGASGSKLAVYQRYGTEHQAQLLDVPTTSQRRATVVAERAPADAPFTQDEAVRRSRGLLPKDARPRTSGPEGNARFVVERFSSAALEKVLPADWFTTRQGEPGDFLVVYARRPDGRVTDVAVGIGNDPAGLLELLRIRLS